MKHILALILSFLFAGHHALQATPADRALQPLQLDSQVKSLVPATVLPLLKNPEDLQVQFLSADFAKSGKYDYIVAAYIVPGAGAKLRVLQNRGGKLETVGEADPSDALEVDDQMHLNLIYVDNSGVPVVRVDSVSADGRNIVTSLYRWTGDRLVSMLPPDTTLTNAYFIDPQGTGVEEIIVPPYCFPSGECTGSQFEVYRLRNGRYTLSATSPVNPNGRGVVIPQRVSLQPAEFSAADVLASVHDTQVKVNGTVVLRIGEFMREPGQLDPVRPADINFNTLYAGRSMRALTSKVIGAKEGKAEGFDGSFVEVVLPRSQVLQYLATAQPTKPPEPGDVVTLPVHARTANGFVVDGSVEVKIIGPAVK